MSDQVNPQRSGIERRSRNKGWSETQSKQADLTEWPGWQADLNTNRKLLSDLELQLPIAIQMLASGQNNELRNALKEISDNIPFAELALLSASQIGDQYQALPDKSTGALGQLTYMPGQDALFGTMQFELAVLCRCINEYYKASIKGDTAALQALREYGAWAVARLEAELRRNGK